MCRHAGSAQPVSQPMSTLSCAVADFSDVSSPCGKQRPPSRLVAINFRPNYLSAVPAPVNYCAPLFPARALCLHQLIYRATSNQLMIDPLPRSADIVPFVYSFYRVRSSLTVYRVWNKWAGVYLLAACFMRFYRNLSCMTCLLWKCKNVPVRRQWESMWKADIFTDNGSRYHFS